MVAFSVLKIHSVVFSVIDGYHGSFSVAFLVIHSGILGQKQPQKITEIWLFTVFTVVFSVARSARDVITFGQVLLLL